jgi:hypothetical protein
MIFDIHVHVTAFYFLFAFLNKKNLKEYFFESSRIVFLHFKDNSILTSNGKHFEALLLR